MINRREFVVGAAALPAATILYGGLAHGGMSTPYPGFCFYPNEGTPPFGDTRCSVMIEIPNELDISWERQRIEKLVMYAA